ncbi:hypothetical protein [Spirosoma fluviale]|uniref:Uncharacterized protein n=1 Tax=Spirosoma fluviale TaxID=1597977 RepID=A0A286GNL4_9BACT|nr:hypothetical protein [Spirosoma fluviale]SOD97127.1 hypothetical protein SAMN06269250_5678 [Spirosoma fluviale]
MRKVFYLSLTLLLACLLIDCKDKTANFSPGPGDPRITGTWRLVERYFSKDSIKSILTVNLNVRHDTILVTVGGQTVWKDTTITKLDTIFVRRDTSFYKTQLYPAVPPQTLTFGADGQVSSNGNEMTYYRSIKNFRVDATYPDSLFVNFFISTNGATIPVPQRLVVQQDMLMLLSNCNQLQPCYSKFVRVK